MLNGCRIRTTQCRKEEINSGKNIAEFAQAEYRLGVFGDEFFLVLLKIKDARCLKSTAGTFRYFSLFIFIYIDLIKKIINKIGYTYLRI